MMLKIAIDKIENWIFVTGVIRSGTTFVGKVLSLPLSVDYIHEPFNPLCGMPGIDRWYCYMRPGLNIEEIQHYHHLTKTIFNYNLTLRSWYPDSDPWSRKIVKSLVGSRGPFYLRLAKTNPFHQTAIIKDPIANLLTEYLYINFRVKPVIVIKHPTSLIASLKRVNWWLNPYDINGRSQLIEDYFSDEPDFFEKDWSDPILGAAAYWRVVHKVLLAQSKKYPDWQIITLEELSENPVLLYKRLYKNLELPWSVSVEQKILKLTQGNRSAQARKNIVQDFKRNSADIFKTQRDSLSIEERKAIFEVVKDVALQIYSQESFALDSSTK
ncbi:MAG: sulfotransferase [Hydrococcus sp. RU_2_2]|nr:sulfotransferase [Hydrococcus sp. RU_2_2]